MGFGPGCFSIETLCENFWFGSWSKPWTLDWGLGGPSGFGSTRLAAGASVGLRPGLSRWLARFGSCPTATCHGCERLSSIMKCSPLPLADPTCLSFCNLWTCTGNNEKTDELEGTTRSSKTPHFPRHMSTGVSDDQALHLSRKNECTKQTI